MDDRAIQVTGKREVQAESEPTRPGPVFMPAVDIFESENEITVLTDMPGVPSDKVTIDLHEGQLVLTGEVGSPGSEKEKYIQKEYEVGKFHRHFSLSDRIDQNRISASMKDGVLRLVLPKAEKAKPRKIKVTGS